jgi:hypothetical protein
LSPALEQGAGPTAALLRLRDVSRLALDAIERDDVGALENCANEGDALVRALTEASDALSDEETRGLLEDVRRMNERILVRVREERDRVAAELVRVGTARARLAAARLEAPYEEDDGEGLDREA